MSMINSPAHYAKGGIEPIEYMKAKLSQEQFEGFLIGNVLKYVSRFQDKNGKEDLRKARYYLDYLIDGEPFYVISDKPLATGGIAGPAGIISSFADEIKRFNEKFLSPIKAKIGNTPPSDINSLIQAAHQNAVDKGWYEEERSFGESIVLIHSELSEALEDYRHGFDVNETYYEGDKPCGIPTELADTVIRIFDLCGHLGIDLDRAIKLKMSYNATRPHRHGDKKL